MVAVGQLSSIRIYPIKGVKSVKLQETEVQSRGLAHDRRWMMVDKNRRFITQRGVKKLGEIHANVTPLGLRVGVSGAEDLEISRPNKNAPRVTVTVWKDEVDAVRVSDEADQWFSDFLGFECSIVFMDDGSVRSVEPAYNPGGATVNFSDGYPLHLTTSGSLDELNSRMKTPLSMERFRPNVTIDGAQPFAEDGWKEIRIGTVDFHVVKPCARCVVTTIDPDTRKSGKEPLKTLSKFRRRGSAVYFGENLIPKEGGIIRVGDPLYVISYRSSSERIF